MVFALRSVDDSNTDGIGPEHAKGRLWISVLSHDIIGGEPIMSAKEHARIEGGQRDAYICRSWNGKGYVMVTTDMNNAMTKALGKQSDWDNYGIDLLTSKDLIHWESKSFDYRKGTRIFSNPEAESVYKDWSTINRVWAPQIFWDPNYVWDNGDRGGSS